MAADISAIPQESQPPESQPPESQPPESQTATPLPQVGRRAVGRRAAHVALVGLFTLAVLYSVYFARDILLPVFLALLLSLLLRPVVRGLYRLGLPEAAGAGLVVLVLLSTLVAGVYVLSGPAADWVDRGPRVLRELEFKLGDIKHSIDRARAASRQIEKIAEPSGGGAPAEVVVRGPSLVEQAMTQTQAIVVNIVILQVLLFFFLAKGRQSLERVITLIPDIDDRIRCATLANTVQRNIAIYLATITVINTLLGLATALVLWSVGMPNPALWGTVAALLNFIPYLGPAATIAILAAVSVLTFDRTFDILLPPVAFLFLATLEGNFLTPMIVGRRLTLNPIAVFLAILFWGWMWGIPGALLAVPVLAVFKIFCDAMPALRAVGALLGE